MIESLGKVTTTAGVRQRLTANRADPAARYACHAVLVQALRTNGAPVYIGTADLDRVALTGVYAQLAAPSGAVIPSFSAALTLAPNAINVADLYLDVDTNGEGVIVTVLVA